MFYTIYKITNQLNGKIYIGSHKTSNLDDNYMGSGKYLIYAQRKHGIENFTKEILFVFDTAQEMYDKEAELVNEEFLATENTYNLKVGGFGGWDYLNNKDLYDNPTHTREHMRTMSSMVPVEVQRTNSSLGIQAIKKMLDENGGKQPWRSSGFKDKTHSDATKRKISESLKAKCSGESNSQYGTRWIHSIEEKVSKKIPKDSPLPEGWFEGRKMKF